VLADADAVERRVRERPALATEPGGPQQWTPLLYVCHTCLHGGRFENLVAIARRLCARGADPHAEYHWNWHPETAAHGAVGRALRGRPPAARRGAARGRRHPTDGVSTHITAGTGQLAALDLLHRHGMDVNSSGRRPKARRARSGRRRA
jgi:hypothetical protein